MKQFILKPYKESHTLAADPAESSGNYHNNPKQAPKPQSKPKPKPKSKSKPAPTWKLQLIRSMMKTHPLSALPIGTLRANIKRTMPNQPSLHQAVTQCIQEASREAVRIKRQGQILIGTYIELLNNIGLDEISEVDREILDHFSKRLVKEDAECLDANNEAEQNDDDDAEIDGKVKSGNAGQLEFLWGFLKSVYSGNPARDVGIGKKVNNFISRLCELGLYTQQRSLSEIKETMPFTPTDLVRSVATDLKAQLERMYRGGSYELYTK
ncbi:hypothetical protein FBU30_003235, partial [Linnemannia zychae]